MADDPEQIQIMRQMLTLAERQTEMSAQRSEFSQFRSFLNTERTLAVWIRTALALMVVGLAIDRFRLLLDHPAGGPAGIHPALETASAWTCMGLVALGVVMVAATGIRFVRYAKVWQSRHRFPAHHGPFLAPAFAFLVAIFGIVLLVIMAAVTAS